MPLIKWTVLRIYISCEEPDIILHIFIIFPPFLDQSLMITHGSSIAYFCLLHIPAFIMTIITTKGILMLLIVPVYFPFPVSYIYTYYNLFFCLRSNITSTYIMYMYMIKHTCTYTELYTYIHTLPSFKSQREILFTFSKG